MAFDLQQDGWPGDRLASQAFQTIRSRVISGLIRLAGAEPVPQGLVKDPTQELSDEGRLRLLAETLDDVAKALASLQDLITAKPPVFPAELAVPTDPAATVAAAMAAVQQGIADVAGIQRVAGAIDAEGSYQLKTLPDRVRPPLAKLINTWSPVRKIFVAIHGIGDQFQSETVQSVAYRVCDYVGVPTALPLGRFHGTGGSVARVFVPEPDRDPPVNCGFAEIYWADVPRVPAADKHILEEPRKWASTLVERIRLRSQKPLDRKRTRTFSLTVLRPLADVSGIPDHGKAQIIVAEVAEVLHFRIFDVDGTMIVDTDVTRLDARGRPIEKLRKRIMALQSPAAPTPRETGRIVAAVIATVDQTRTREDDDRLERLLEELIQGVNVADRLTFLAEKAGLFKFDLAELLNDYVNDVQVVTEFEDYRRQLLDIFGDVLAKIHRYFGASEIYLVAHSEGTVISFLGLLKGLSERAEWARNVRGYMTIGSPLNKHVRFWPELFDRYSAAAAEPGIPPIPWKNYYDFGDPIGYDLTPTRHWMDRTGWRRFFVFRDERNQDDIGFTRYYFPAAAHNDYWHDETVFGHFIEEVVDRTGAVLRRAQAKPYGLPGTRLLAAMTSYPLPYILSVALLFLASYVVYKSVRGCLDPIGAVGNTSGGPLQRARPDGDHRRNVAPRQDSAPGSGGTLAGHGGCAGRPLLRGLLPDLGRESGQHRGLPLGLRLTGPLPQHLQSLPHYRPYWRGRPLLLFIEGLRPVMLTLLPVVLAILLLRCVAAALTALAPPVFPAWPWRSLAVVAIAWLIGFRAWRVSWLYPSLGTKPLVHTGGLILFMIVATEFAFHRTNLSADERAAVERGLKAGERAAIAQAVADEIQEAFSRLPGVYRDREPARHGHDPDADLASDRRLVRDASEMQIIADAALDEGPIWPVLVAGAFYLYLWWLAVVLFDLTFVWHVYIRWSGAQKYVDTRLGPP